MSEMNEKKTFENEIYIMGMNDKEITVEDENEDEIKSIKLDELKSKTKDFFILDVIELLLREPKNMYREIERKCVDYYFNNKLTQTDKTIILDIIEFIEIEDS